MQNEEQSPSRADLPNVYDPRKLYVALWNLPGCMPEVDPFRSLEWNAARDALREQIEAEAESASETMGAFASGETPHVEAASLLAECEAALRAIESEAVFGEPFALQVGAYVYSVGIDSPDDDDDEDRRAALGALLEVDLCDVEEADFGVNTFAAGGLGEFLILTDEEADEAASEAIERDLWAFQPDFLEHYMPSGVDASVLQAIAEAKYEDASEAFASMLGVDGVEAVKRDAIAYDGRGHFLAQYDFEERESGDFFAYRVN
jgi:hypothetical protein